MSQEIKINGLQPQRLNSFVLFKNQRKEAENHPDMKGAMNCQGEDFEIALWFKKTAKGDDMLTGTIKTPFVKGSGNKFPSHPPAQVTFVTPIRPAQEEDEIPF